MGTKTGKGWWLWQHTDHSAESLFLCSTASCLQDFKGYLTLTLRSVQMKGVFYLLREIAECHSNFMTSREMVMCGMRPVSLSSGSLCHFVWKNWIFFFSKWTYITHPFLPHPPLTRHAIGMKGVTQVEQDGFTSANVGNKTSAAYFAWMQDKRHM